MACRRRYFALLLLSGLFAAAPAQADDTLKSDIVFDGRHRSYFVYAPEGGMEPRPLLVLLHGTGGSGASMLKQWKELAAREHIVLLAPDSLRPEIGWDLRSDGPAYIDALVTQLQSSQAIDPHRIYLSGYSAGAVYALTLGMLESELFAAVAIQSGAWRSQRECKAASYAARKIPVWISVGDRDEFFSLAAIHNTRRTLEDAGIPVELNILEARHHFFSDVPADFTGSEWNFLKRNVLSGTPKYTDYH